MKKDITKVIYERSNVFGHTIKGVKEIQSSTRNAFYSFAVVLCTITFGFRYVDNRKKKSLRFQRDQVGGRYIILTLFLTSISLVVNPTQVGGNENK